MQTLKPCPFCHKTSHLKIEMYLDPTFEEYHGFTVVCSAAGYEGTERGCGSSGGWGETEEDAATAWNTRPVAPVDGLERYDLEDKSQFNEGCYMRPDETGEYVRFDQAVAIIAAERSRADKAEADAEKYREYAAEKSNQVATLQKDNAALTARVKELEASLKTRHTDDMNDMVLIGMARDDAEKSAKALEPELAAARKALEPFSKYAGTLFERNFNDPDIINQFGGYRLTAKDFFEARAALEAKP